jgi:hypothetical protein
MSTDEREYSLDNRSRTAQNQADVDDLTLRLTVLIGAAAG